MVPIGLGFRVLPQVLSLSFFFFLSSDMTLQEWQSWVDVAGDGCSF
jgi:hypothetical protein